MRLFIACLAALALLAPPAMACPPVDPTVDPGGGGSFSYGAGADTAMCEAPIAIAGNFGGAGYGGCGGGVQFAAPSYSASFASPAYAAPLVQRRVFAAPAYGYGASFAAPVRVRSFGYGVSRRFGGFGVGSYGGAIVAAPVVHTRAFAAPIYGGAAVVAAPVVAVPVRAVGPIRGAISGFRAGLRNRLSGF